MDKSSYDYIFDILLCGFSCVGKSSILYRFINGTYKGPLEGTIGFDWSSKVISIQTIDNNEKKLKLKFWDSNGQERCLPFIFGCLRKFDFKAVVLVYDITNEDSFERLPICVTHINNNGSEGLIKVLVGNNCGNEKKRKISFEKGEEFARKNNMMFIETCPRLNINIDKLFTDLIKAIFDKEKNDPHSKPTLKNNPDEMSNE
ncbi:unnamed protein product [Brachionus calyciflorus]|uniref:Uncharacterized protein n=1 Tax=Brachionus calyciflorus TaxID=104777 RepID=A0A813LXY1_9BILA|nr:unnamed protein product [Brachionus calyciflorus]